MSREFSWKPDVSLTSSWKHYVLCSDASPMEPWEIELGKQSVVKRPDAAM